MRRLQLSGTGAVVPHAPLLLREVAGDATAAATAAVGDAVTSLDLGRADVTVVASPHGASTGVYSSASGSLDAFGPRGIDVSAPVDRTFAAELAREWGRPLLDRPMDHGIVVPLRLLCVPSSVVAVAFAEGLTADEAVSEAESLTRALVAVAAGRDVAFVASANTSAGITERAPLPSLDGAAAADEGVLHALADGPGGLLERVEPLLRAGSCAAAPLAAFALLFPGRRCDVRAYEHPFGVGYPVAVTR